VAAGRRVAHPFNRCALSPPPLQPHVLEAWPEARNTLGSSSSSSSSSAFYGPLPDYELGWPWPHRQSAGFIAGSDVLQVSKGYRSWGLRRLPLCCSCAPVSRAAAAACPLCCCCCLSPVLLLRRLIALLRLPTHRRTPSSPFCLPLQGAATAAAARDASRGFRSPGLLGCALRLGGIVSTPSLAQALGSRVTHKVSQLGMCKAAAFTPHMCSVVCARVPSLLLLPLL